MFDTAKIGRQLKKSAFKQATPGLRTELLEAQIGLREKGIPLIVIIAGMEGSGKGEVVNRLDEWLDARGVNVKAFWKETDEERERPRPWRFWRALPARGEIAILFGGWYLWPIEQRFLGKWDDAELEQSMRRARDMERQLVADGAVIVKFWYHFSEKDQRKRLASLSRDDRSRWKMLPKKATFSRQYNLFEQIADQIIRTTDTGRSPWHIVEATDAHYRDLTTGRILLKAMQTALARNVTATRDDSTENSAEDALETLIDAPEARITLLDRVDLSKTVSKTDYRDKLDRLQCELSELSWQAYKQGQSMVLVFEGVDAAGKGGAIRRITQAVDSRLREVIPIAAPTEEERAHHYLWRFWRHLPAAGRSVIFDRSWYGRVLVERIEEFAREDEWRRAYHEINDFEDQLTGAGIIVQKFWLQISKEEQLARFQAREDTPYKRYKITDEDWRNREKWNEYRAAVNEMLGRTNTRLAPWHVIPGNDKRYARITVLETVVKALRQQLQAEKPAD